MNNNFDERIHYVGLASPVDTGSTTVTSDVINMGKYQYADLLVYFGTITGDTVVVTVEACTSAAGAGNTAIAYNYRKSGATGTSDTMGAISAATTAGVTIAATDDNKMLLISINNSELSDGSPYLRVVADPGGSATAVGIAVVAIMHAPRYAQNNQITALT